MDLKNKLYLEGCLSVVNKNELSASVETYITLFVLNCCENYNFNLCFVDTGIAYPCSLPVTSMKCMSCEFIKDTSDAFQDPYPSSELQSSKKTRSGALKIGILKRDRDPIRNINLNIEAICCSLPAVQAADTYFGGLCAVLRWTIILQTKNSSDHPCRSLLGFRGNCLVACSESSIWTKFCEVEMPEAVKKMFEILNFCQDCLTLPSELMKLEMHLSKPVRTHNILKRKQDIAKNLKRNFPPGKKSSEAEEVLQKDKERKQNIFSNGDFFVCDSDCSTVDAKNIAEMLRKVKITEVSDNFHLQHCYVEGIDLTLSDFILLPCVHYLLCYMKSFSSPHLTHVLRWYDKMFANTAIQRGVMACGWCKWNSEAALLSERKLQNIVVPVVEPISLYSRDPCRPKLKCRNFDPSSVLSCLKKYDIHPKYDQEFYEGYAGLKWKEIPAVLHPSSGDLPENRIERKSQQLESIVWAVLKIAKPNQTIVDFCAGGGHVGLLLAYYLKDCQIILVENKEASMRRAIDRARALNLTNVKFFQCNLDYFKGCFDIGVSLHACGVATDLVIQQCLQKKAGFVCCPCCYGSIQETHLLKYPLSRKFRDASLSYDDFRYLAHCADRTEVNTPKAKQGKLCMGLIDTDRKMSAEELDYKVWLSTLQPESCSPKHNVLVGIPHLWLNS